MNAVSFKLREKAAATGTPAGKSLNDTIIDELRASGMEEKEAKTIAEIMAPSAVSVEQFVDRATLQGQARLAARLLLSLSLPLAHALAHDVALSGMPCMCARAHSCRLHGWPRLWQNRTAT